VSAATRLLDRLVRVKQTRPGAWLAACPCCESKRGRPVSVRELDDGRLLVHPFCGCSTDAVLNKLGLQLGDLFPQRLPAYSYPATHSRVPAADLLTAINHEVTVACLILEDICRQGTVTEAQRARLFEAAALIGTARADVRH
jgi:hypothetical protein